MCITSTVSFPVNGTVNMITIHCLAVFSQRAWLGPNSYVKPDKDLLDHRDFLKLCLSNEQQIYQTVFNLDCFMFTQCNHRTPTLGNHTSLTTNSPFFAFGNDIHYQQTKRSNQLSCSFLFPEPLRYNSHDSFLLKPADRCLSRTGFSWVLLQVSFLFSYL